MDTTNKEFDGKEKRYDTLKKREPTNLQKVQLIRKELKQTYKHNFSNLHIVPEIELPMQRVEARTFVKGSNGNSPNQRPKHRVHITQDYWLGTFPVTQREYKAIMGRNPSHFKADNNPVEKVSWNHARKFCTLLTEKEKKAGRLPNPYIYRLPTEAEWELACRANQPDDFFTDVEEFMWYYKNSNEKSHEVGQKKPNNWGFFDMQGNVFEWCLDCCDFRLPNWYNQNNTLTPLQRNDVINPYWRQGSNRIAKGGAWLFDIDQATPASKYINPPDSCYFIIGFRLTLGLPI